MIKKESLEGTVPFFIITEPELCLPPHKFVCRIVDIH